MFHLYLSQPCCWFWNQTCLLLQSLCKAFYPVVLWGWIPAGCSSFHPAFSAFQPSRCCPVFSTVTHVLGGGGVPGLLTQTNPSPRKPSTDLLQPPFSAQLGHPRAEPCSHSLLITFSTALFTPHILEAQSEWCHSCADIWRAVLSKAEGRVAWKEHQFTQSPQLWWATSTTFSDFFFFNLCHINPHVYECVITYMLAYGKIWFVKLFCLPKLLPKFKCFSLNCFVILKRLFMKLYDRRKLCSMLQILL